MPFIYLHYLHSLLFTTFCWRLRARFITNTNNNMAEKNHYQKWNTFFRSSEIITSANLFANRIFELHCNKKPPCLKDGSVWSRVFFSHRGRMIRVFALDLLEVRMVELINLQLPTFKSCYVVLKLTTKTWKIRLDPSPLGETPVI